MRFRIDFTVKELDVPDDRARGITFGDEVDGSAVAAFFDRCRDAFAVLFTNTATHQKKDVDHRHAAARWASARVAPPIDDLLSYGSTREAGLDEHNWPRTRYQR